MKTTLKLVSLVIALNLPAAMANEGSTGPYLSIGHNWFNFDNDRVINDDDNVYFGLGYQATDHVAFELKYTDVRAEYLNLSTVYRYQPRNTDSFYWKAGLADYSNIVTDGTALSLGMGYEAHINKVFSLTFGVDSMFQFNNDATDLAPYIGFNIFFGDNDSKPLAVKKARLDNDKDGVFNNLDQCPNSANGITVDSNGCELDSDNDGVVNSLDQCLQTPNGAKVDQKGCRIILTEDVSIKLNVQFNNNSNEISKDYYSEIEKVAIFMSEYPDTSVVIEGHTDSRGASSYNQKLSQKRANAVMAYLVTQFKINQSRISAVGKGEISPIASNETAEGRATNRRVQAEIKASVSKPQ